jgi:hypothetical protein
MPSKNYQKHQFEQRPYSSYLAPHNTQHSSFDGQTLGVTAEGLGVQTRYVHQKFYIWPSYSQLPNNKPI